MHLSLRNPTPLQPGQRWPMIDAIKGYALILVLLYHIGGILGWNNLLHGEVGVDIFLMISGLTLTLSSAHVPLREFLTRRMLRIFPAYWVALLLFSLLRAYQLNMPPSGTSVWLHIFGIHGFAPGIYFSDINDSFWFISLILAMYLVFLGVRSRLDDASFPLGVAMILTVIAAALYIRADHTGGLIQLAVRIPSFFAGVVLGQYLSRSETRVSVSPSLVIGLLAITFLGWTKGIITFYLVACLGMTGAFVGLILLIKRMAIGNYVMKAFALLGVYSYEIFLFHQPLIRDYNYFVYRKYLRIEPNHTQVTWGIWIGLGVTLLISVMVHHLVALLFRRWGPGKLTSNTAASSP